MGKHHRFVSTPTPVSARREQKTGKQQRPRRRFDLYRCSCGFKHQYAQVREHYFASQSPACFEFRPVEPDR